MLSQTQQVSAFELAIYALLFPVTLFILVRHGHPGILGWLYLNIFATLRLVGAGLTISNGTSTGALIINAVGLSPLLLANAGVIREMYVPLPQICQCRSYMVGGEEEEEEEEEGRCLYEADTFMEQ